MNSGASLRLLRLNPLYKFRGEAVHKLKRRKMMELTAIDVILNGIRATLEPPGIDKEEEKILKEKDERRELK